MSQEYALAGKRYRVKIGSGEGDAWEVSIFEVSEDGARETEAGRFSARLAWVEGDTYALSIGGKRYLGMVASGPDGDEVFIGGETHFIVPPGRAAPRRKAAAQGAGQHVSPPMPGVVIKILASVGERVEKGQGVIVISAMKMETTLASPRTGIVTRIGTKVNARVKPGDVLIEVEEEGAQRE